MLTTHSFIGASEYPDRLQGQVVFRFFEILSAAQKRDEEGHFRRRTSYSGSTFLDMILANDPRGFSCGEVHALFRPFRPHHLNPSCGCGRAGCPIWRTVKKLGVRHLYRSIFGLLPEIDFIVDSSKDPLWIDRQARYLRADGFTCKNILIWKSPAEMEASCRKRGHGNHWARKWTAYHRLYFSVVPHYAACSYGPLITDPTLLSAVCEYLARIDHRFGNEGDFGRPERFSESFAIDPVQVE